MLETEVKKLTDAVVALTKAMTVAPDVRTTYPDPKPEVVPELTPTVEEPAPAPTAMEPVAPTTAAPTLTMTIDDVREKLSVVIQANGPSAVEAALNTMGVSMLSEVPAERYTELLTAVGA